MPGSSSIIQRSVVVSPKEPLLAAEPRSLAKLLKRLRDPKAAALVLTQCCAAQKLDLDRLLSTALLQPQQAKQKGGGWDAETELARLTEQAFEESKLKRNCNRKTTQTIGGVVVTPKKQQHQRSRNSKKPKNNHDLEDSLLMPPPTSVLVSASTPVISSDSEDGSSSIELQQQDQEVSPEQMEQELAELDFWNHLLEHVHLHVSSRTTTMTVGRKKVYEIYRLAGPTMPIAANCVETIRAAVQREFLIFYDGITSSSSKLCDLRFSECRVYAVLQKQTNLLWIQINIGRSLEATEQQQRNNEFVAVVPSECSTVALAGKRSSRFTPCVLAALETALTCSVAGGYGGANGEYTATVIYLLLKQFSELINVFLTLLFLF